LGWTYIEPLKHPRAALAAATYDAPRRPNALVGPAWIYALGGFDETGPIANQ
jgi:hypothetical protein